MARQIDKIILGFGSFDGLHDGHKFFISELKNLGKKVVVAVATDEVINLIKKRPPKFSLEERIAVLKNEFGDIEVISSDSEIGNWRILEKVKPDIVAIGYDQMDLKESLESSDIKRRPEIVIIQSYKSEIFKSSLLE